MKFEKNLFLVSVFVLTMFQVYRVQALETPSIINIGGTDYSLRAHPRIFIGGDTSLVDLRAKAIESNKYWRWLRDYYVDLRVGTPDYTDLEAPQALTMSNYAMLYIVDPVAYADMGQAAKEILLNHTNPLLYDTSCDGSHNCGNKNIDYGRIQLMRIAQTYDWIYPLLSESEKSEFLTWVNDELYPLIEKHTHNGQVIHNLHHTHMTALMMFALATYEDNQPGVHGSSGNNSVAYFNWAYDTWFNEVKPIVDEKYIGGHTWSGSAYGLNRTYPYFFYMLNSLDSAIGYDQWAASPWTDDIINYMIHSSFPSNLEFTGSYNMYSDGNVGGDKWSSRGLEAFFMSLSHHAGSDKARKGYWFLDNVIKPSGEYSPGYFRMHQYELYQLFLWLTPNVQGLDYSINEPTALHSSGVGLYQARSAWNDSGATWFALAATDWIGDHQGHNTGSYKIFKKEHLLYENGASGNAMGGDRNNILVLDDGIIKKWWGKLETTGGYGSLSDLSLAGPLEASIIKNKSDLYYNYAKADLVDYYVDNRNMKKLDSYTRQVLQLKPNGNSSADYLLVFDKVKTIPGAGSVNGVNNGQPVVLSNYLHFPSEPSINGNQIEVISKGNKSKLITETLAPSNISITKEDVADRTSFIDGDNVWRAKIQSNMGSVDDRFLLLHYPSTNINAVMPDLTRIQSVNDNMMGALILESNTSRVVMFSNIDSNIDSTSYSVNYSESFPGKHILVDIEPGNYDIYRNSSVLERDVPVSSEGILMFNSTGGGVFSVTRDNSIVLPVRADADNNGGIDFDDSLLILKRSLNMNMTSTSWYNSSTTGDANCDGVVNIKDALLSFRYSLGLSMSATSWCE